MERWTEHYHVLYSLENVVSDKATENPKPLPTMEELESPSTIDKLRKAINSHSCGKAPGSDGIPPEIVKGELSPRTPARAPVTVLGRGHHTEGSSHSTKTTVIAATVTNIAGCPSQRCG